MNKAYQKLFKTCAAEGLPAWECPNFVFSIMGLVTIAVMLTTYFISRVYLSLELVAFTVIAATVVFLILSYSVSNGIQRMARAKNRAEFEKAKTDAIIKHLSDGLIMLDSKCRVALVNPRAQKYLGVKEDRVLGFDVRENIAETDEKQFFKVAHWCPASSDNIPNKVFVEEFALLKPIRRFIKVQTSSVQNEEGKLIGFIKVLHDITRDKELDEIKSDFISIASHQLKTPLSTIKWNLEVLDKQTLGDLGPEQQKILEQAIEANEEMIEVVRDLLDVSRIEQGRVKPQMQRSSLPEVITKVYDHYLPLAEKHNIELKKSLPEHDIKFSFDPEAIKMVITNLVDNAIKYTPGHGQVEIKLTYQPPDNPNEAVVEVSDTGVGIPPEDQAKLFTKFYRAKNIKKMNTKGTGLGLYIARNIISLHGGKLTMESVVNQGSTFKIILPLKLSNSN